MARPSHITEKRCELLPTVAQTFAELGYRRTTTAELARRCGVQENILYRLWHDKKAMFIAVIEHVYELSAEVWRELLRSGDGASTPAERLLAYEATHHGEFGHYRIVFAGLSETDDPDIRAALSAMYQRYQRFIASQIRAHRQDCEAGTGLDPALAAWAVVGLGTVANISRELGLVDDQTREQLLREAGRSLLNSEHK